MDAKKLLKNYWWIVCGLGLCLLLLLFFAIVRLTSFSSVPENEEVLVSYTSSKDEEKQAENEEETTLWVDIKGAVVAPCMYQGEKNMRVWDVLQLAGGVKEIADTKQVNYALLITDQMVIYIPEQGEEIPKELLKQENLIEETPESSNAQNKINLNQATEQELQNLTGIGQKKAQEIIRYRQENDGFKTIDELKNISGIGDKTFEKLADSITV